MTLPIPATAPLILLISMIIAGAGLVTYGLITQLRRRKNTQISLPLNAMDTVAIMISPVWIALIAYILVGLTRMAIAFDPTHQDADLRWHILGFVGLVTALGALISAPLALIRVYTTERQTRTAEQGHMTDRISKAVEQLGAEKTVKIPGKDENGKDITLEQTKPNIEVRIGGLLSLERISQDSVKYDKGRDHVRVMEIICAYVRENAPAVRENAPASGAVAAPPPPKMPQDATPEQLRELWFAYKQTLNDWAKTLPAPRKDIATALDIIARRDTDQLRFEARWGKTALPDAEWVYATPAPTYPEGKDGAEPTKAQRETSENALQKWEQTLTAYAGYRPDLRRTNLQGADLSGMALAGIRFDHAQLQGAVLRNAQLQGANLVWAQLQEADLWEAQLQGAFLKDAQLQGACLIDAQLQGAFLGWAQLQGANLGWAQLQGANLRWAQLQGAVLECAQVDAATQLSAADVSQAALSQVDFTNVNLSPDQINSMFGDGSVTLPRGITPDHADWPPHWPKQKLGWDDFDTEWRKWQANPTTYTPP